MVAFGFNGSFRFARWLCLVNSHIIESHCAYVVVCLGFCFWGWGLELVMIALVTSVLIVVGGQRLTSRAYSSISCEPFDSKMESQTVDVLHPDSNSTGYIYNCTYIPLYTFIYIYMYFQNLVYLHISYHIIYFRWHKACLLIVCCSPMPMAWAWRTSWA